MLKRITYYMITPITCMLTICASSLEAQCCRPAPCCQEDECDPCCGGSGGGRGWGRDALIFAGAAAVGAIAGVAAANSNKKRGRRGDPGIQGEQGPRGLTGAQGPAGFGLTAAPLGTTLTFAETLAFAGAVPGGTVTPFVETPDGRTLLGTPVTGPFAIGLLPLSPITDTAPVFGTYSYGFVLSPGFVVTLGVTSSALITTNRVGASPTSEFLDAGINIAPNQTQVIEQFAFGDVPPVP